MIVEFSLEFSPPHVHPKIRKPCGGSIKRESIYVTYTTLPSVVITLVF